VNAISGPTAASAVSQLWTTGAVRPVRRIPSDAERMPASGTDRFEPSDMSQATPAITYGRNGRMCGGP
jgi:hypothetical protein